MVSSIDIVVDCIVSLLLKLNVFFVFVTMSSYDESDEDYSSSDFCIPIQTNHSNSNPPQTVNHITESEFQIVKCYGYEIEFPKGKTPFPSQMSVMTQVILIICILNCR